MKTNSNSYTIIYSVIIVVIVAFLLAFVSSSLKATQDANVALDTQKQILNSLNLRDLDNATAAAKYKEVVKDEKEKDGMKYYECEIDGQKKTVYSVKGMGLWGGISGFIAVDADNNNIIFSALSFSVTCSCSAIDFTVCSNKFFARLSISAR